MNFYKLLDIETGEDLYVNPKHIVFYMRTADGVLIDNGSVRILTLKADFENMMLLEGASQTVFSAFPLPWPVQIRG